MGGGGVGEGATVPELSRRYGVHANQIYKWKRELLDNAGLVFSRGERKNDGANREPELLRKIGELTVERDFLSNGLAHLR